MASSSRRSPTVEASIAARIVFVFSSMENWHDTFLYTGAVVAYSCWIPYFLLLRTEASLV